MRADSFFMHFILKNDASGSFLSMHGNRKVGSAEPTSEERVKRNEKSASASTTGVVVRATQTESPLNRLLPHPLPLPQKDRRSIIQRMLHPHPLLLFVPHPQDVAVKSLISYLQGYLFYLCYIICRKACMCFSCTIKFFVLFLLIKEACCSKEMQRDEGG